MRRRPRWVLHTAQKRPVTPDGAPASVSDSATWSPWSTVRRRPMKGFMLGDGIGCIDLDHCLVDGAPTPAAAAFLAQVPETYIETSPSGDGLHVWGLLPEGAGSRRTVDGLAVETYSRERYITVTEQPYRGAPPILADLTPLLALVGR
ncbi:bifunctional DNA primase/polymerase [Nocardia neocaledoniensis]|uniref:bifunctional DNA primase/polymerase n=1 Tax=Nocardia neocaledoniensis TaxID=236511 RepID=UPI0033CD06E8